MSHCGATSIVIRFMWLFLALIACTGAFLAGRSWFWHIAIARLLVIGCTIYMIAVCWVMISSGYGFDWLALLSPPVGIYVGAIALRWAFSPRPQRIPIMSIKLARSGAEALWRHLGNNVHHFAGRELW